MIGWPELTHALQQGVWNKSTTIWHGWLQITNCPSREPASMAQCSHKECLHHYHEAIRSSSLPCSTCRPSQKAFKLERSDDATKKEVAGTDNGASCRLKTSIWKASHWTVAGFFFLIASERNKLSIKHVLGFYHSLLCLSTQRWRRHSTALETQNFMNSQHML